MTGEEIAKYVKAGTALLTAFGIVIDPDDAATLGASAAIIYGVVSTVQGRYFKREKNKIIK